MDAFATCFMVLRNERLEVIELLLMHVKDLLLFGQPPVFPKKLKELGERFEIGDEKVQKGEYPGMTLEQEPSFFC